MHIPNRFTIAPPPDTTRALYELAQTTGADPRRLAADLLREALEYRGALDRERTALTLVLNTDRADRVLAALAE